MFTIQVILLLHISVLSKFIADGQSDPFPVSSSNGLHYPGYSGTGNHQPNGQRGGDFAGFWTSLLGGEGCGRCNQCSSCSGCNRCGSSGAVVNNVVNNININNNVNFYPGPVTDPVTSTPTTTPPDPPCQVTIYGGPFVLSVCGQEVFSPTFATGCAFSRLSFQLLDLPCAYVQSDGSIVFDYIGFGCTVGQVDYGTLTATDTWTGKQLYIATITVDTTYLQSCIITVTPTPTSVPCTVLYLSGQYITPYQCDMVILSPPSTPGCAPSQVSYQLSNMPCNQLLSDGSVIVSLANYGNGCDVGPGFVYYGILTAIDSYSGSLLGTWNLQMDTSSLSGCIGGTTTTTTTTVSATPQSACNATSVFYQPHYTPTNCTERLFSVVIEHCFTGLYQVFYDFTGLPSCFGVHSPFYSRFAGSFYFAPIVDNVVVCDVGQGIVYSGNLTARFTDAMYRPQIFTWPFSVDTSGLEYCMGTSVPSSYQPCYVTRTMDPQYLPQSYRPTSCNRTILATVTVTRQNCEDFAFDVTYGVSGFDSCAAVQFVDAVLFFEVSSDKSCDVGGGMQHVGTAIMYNSPYTSDWETWSIKLLTGGVQHCVSEWGQSTSTSATTPWP